MTTSNQTNLCFNNIPEIDEINDDNKSKKTFTIYPNISIKLNILLGKDLLIYKINSSDNAHIDLSITGYSNNLDSIKKIKLLSDVILCNTSDKEINVDLYYVKDCNVVYGDSINFGLYIEEISKKYIFYYSTLKGYTDENIISTFTKKIGTFREQINYTKSKTKVYSDVNYGITNIKIYGGNVKSFQFELQNNGMNVFSINDITLLPFTKNFCFPLSEHSVIQIYFEENKRSSLMFSSNDFQLGSLETPFEIEYDVVLIDK
jgi:ASC-1-like (ASCH) protein